MKQSQKKALAFVTAAVSLLQGASMLTMSSGAAASTQAVQEQRLLLGDVNYDERLDAFDLALMKESISTGFDTRTSGVADLNGDAVFNEEDIKLLQDYLLVKIAEFPAGTHYIWQEKIPETDNGQIALTGSRIMERLDRGVVAVNSGNGVFVSWRLLASDKSDIGFNVYRTTDGETIKVNTDVLYGGTNFTDTTADITKENTYSVKTVYSNQEWESDGSFTLPANKGTGAYYTVPIQAGGTVHFVWTGDFNGDGAYDYLLDRCADDHQKLEAYLNDGTYLWTVDLGYNSENKNNISPGASTIDVGMWDGATVYDMDCDGYADVLLRIADGVTFGDGTVYSNSTTNGQAIAVIDGRTGALKTTAPVPDDYIAIGPVACMMEVGYLNGSTPSLVCWFKNRNADKSFNSMMVAYGYAGDGTFEQQWKYDATKYGGGGEAHQIRVADVDYDGKDEVLHMGYCLNGDGTLRYQIPELVHGDRWYVGSFCNENNETEMFGYGIQQNNESGLLEYMYNASTGEVFWTNYGDISGGLIDVGRGNIGDIDPNHDGLEVWSFQGTYRYTGEKISDNYAYPVFRIFWDGDLFSESYNEGKIEKWNYQTQGTERVDTTWKIYGSSGSDRGVGMLHADIIGDWREETVHVNYDTAELVIYTTTIPSDERIYCLAQNPCYRNCMTAKGYYQANMLDYFLGHNMETPKTPDICYAGEVNMDETAVYAIRNANSGRCMDVYKSGREDGTNVQQYGTVASKANNTWTLKDAGDGYYYIISKLTTGNNCYLTVSDGADTDGANVEISTFDGSDSQKFRLQRNADGSCLLLTKCSGNTKCVEISAGSADAGANVQQWTVNGEAWQNWNFEKIS